ncbi:DUF411 domain-containing protein [Stenotrophomonas ginsengisoli]|nr:DUF411 domain-containing protein [Stenotrophomonas ginsengisoli]
MTVNRLLLTSLLAASLLGPALAQPRPAASTGPRPAAATALPEMSVHRHPSCGCCGGWVEHMRHAGFSVRVNNVQDVMAPKQRLGVPASQASCHTTEVGGYVVEGHVPASDILKLLRDKPRARGLVLPGMPLGSPGMEAPDGSAQAYTVQLLGLDGSLRDFSHHPARTGKPQPTR